MHRRTCLGLITGLAGCSLTDRSEDDHTVRVAISPYLSMSSFHLAWERGYFREEGLELEVNEIPFTAQIVPLLAGGGLDAAFLVQNPSFLNAVAKGVEARIVAGREIASPQCGDAGALYYSADLFPDGLTDLHQLRGRSLAIVRRATISEFWLDEILATAGLAGDDVQVIELPQADAAAAVIEGKIDAMVSQDFDKDPAAISGKAVRFMRLADVLPGYQYTWIVFGERLLRSARPDGVGFLAAYQKGVHAFLAGESPRFMRDYAERNGLDVASTLTSCRQTITPDGAIDIDDLARFTNWAVAKGYCERALSARELVDTGFLAGIREK